MVWGFSFVASLYTSATSPSINPKPKFPSGLPRSCTACFGCFRETLPTGSERTGPTESEFLVSQRSGFGLGFGVSVRGLGFRKSKKGSDDRISLKSK